MQISLLVLILLGLMAIGYHFGRRRSLTMVGGGKGIRKLHSSPVYYGTYVLLWAAIPAIIVLLAWGLFEDTLLTSMMISDLPERIRNMPSAELNLIINDIKNLATGSIVSSEPTIAIKDASEQYIALQKAAEELKVMAMFSLSAIASIFAWRSIEPRMRARNRVESIIKLLLIISSLIAILTTIGIVLSVLFESIRFFNKISFFDFLFGLEWSPQTALRDDQIGATGAFGAIPLFAGTLLISFIAMLVATPIGLMSAIYLAEYASPSFRNLAKPVLEVLAGIPTVVYGFFAALTVAPSIRGFGEAIGLEVASESALAAGLVMGLMIIPFISSLSDDVINSVPQSLRDAAYGLGATRSEAIKQVILPAALPGIMGGVLLAVSRAIGETMIVVMAAGLSANLSANPLEAVTTVTVQIVTLLVGDQEFDSSKTLAAFALGLILFVVTLSLNVIALNIVRKYHEQYD